MTKPYAIRGELLPLSSTTTDFQPHRAARAGTVQKLRCRVGVAGGSGQHQTSEVAPLLRYRLKVASLLTATVFGIYLVRSFMGWSAPPGPTAVGLAIHSIVVAVMVAICTVLWTTWPFGVRALRVMEVTLFGAAAMFFVYMHFAVFNHGQVLEWANPNYKARIASLANTASNMRWFVIIVLYGTFIPNTWRRCATVVGLLAAIPVALNFWTCTTCPQMGPVSGPSPIVDTFTVLGLAAAIAIFGSYKISVLQQEAVVARELGQYRLKQKLGSGGMGEVYLGEHLMLRRQCAIKLIRPDQTGDPANLERFEREVRSMATLTHCNTVEVFDFGHADDGTFYYVMEYLPGLSLQELVDKFGPLPADRAVHFLRQICLALQEAHSIGLIHRDIKPSNVIACERGGVYDVAKLLDFGLVQCIGLGKDTGKLTVQGVILGSPPYMSPEQALGRSNLDAHTDIYSLGAVAYFLVTGQPPFIRETPMELLVAHAHEKPTPLSDLRPDIPEDLQALIMQCLEKEPSRRFADADTLEQALAACACADLWTRHSAARWWRASVGTSSSSEDRVLVG
jgi:serine/threonine-protein kinase